MNYEEILREIINCNREYYPSEDKAVFAKYFPELKESEDERIRKELIEQIAYITPNVDELDDELNTLPSYQERINKYRVWLEKQDKDKEECALKSSRDEDVDKFMRYIEKQAKAYEFNLPNRGYDIYAFAKDILHWREKQDEKKSTDKVEPKFKVGDKVTVKGDNTIYTIGIVAPDKTCWLKHGSREYGWATFGVLKHYVE